MSKEICQRCGEKDYDRRTLWMSCLYEMAELDVPFEQKSVTVRVDKVLKANESFEGKPIETSEFRPHFYTLLVCKGCRGDWMGAIEKWFKEKPIRESCGSGIFVRRNGATVEITEEEWKEENPNREPIRVIK
jgi:hypothetical protein